MRSLEVFTSCDSTKYPIAFTVDAAIAVAKMSSGGGCGGREIKMCQRHGHDIHQPSVVPDNVVESFQFLFNIADKMLDTLFRISVKVAV